MSMTVALVISIAIFAAVIAFALKKMKYVRAALSFYRVSFELEARDGLEKELEARNRIYASRS